MDSIDVDILTPKSPEGDLFRFAGTFYSRREITPPSGGRGVPLNPLKGTYSASRVLFIPEGKLLPL
jgi:hypothetical protein